MRERKTSSLTHHFALKLYNTSSKEPQPFLCFMLLTSLGNTTYLFWPTSHLPLYHSKTEGHSLFQRSASLISAAQRG